MFLTFSIINSICDYPRYPRLYDFFYAELELASKAIQQEEIPSRLHPLLLLISRLYPSGAGSIDSNSKLLSFVPFISACSSSPELMTRKLTAKSIVALVPFQSVIPYCLGLLDSIKVNIRIFSLISNEWVCTQDEATIFLQI